MPMDVLKSAGLSISWNGSQDTRIFIQPEPVAALKPHCKLTGTDGNVFALAGRVSAALKRAGMPEKAKEFTDKVFACESYDAELRLMCEYVDAR